MLRGFRLDVFNADSSPADLLTLDHVPAPEKGVLDALAFDDLVIWHVRLQQFCPHLPDIVSSNLLMEWLWPHVCGSPIPWRLRATVVPDVTIYVVATESSLLLKICAAFATAWEVPAVRALSFQTTAAIAARFVTLSRSGCRRLRSNPGAARHDLLGWRKLLLRHLQRLIQRWAICQRGSDCSCYVFLREVTHSRDKFVRRLLA
mmetsp:Transcript_139232/g.266989  ORF Transcript_139232/g.266989 Transcript_139232/m.266989 type:complete len:204 (+) Transcript_139232:682-1293(+)